MRWLGTWMHRQPEGGLLFRQKPRGATGSGILLRHLMRIRGVVQHNRTREARCYDDGDDNGGSSYIVIPGSAVHTMVITSTAKYPVSHPRRIPSSVVGRAPSMCVKCGWVTKATHQRKSRDRILSVRPTANGRGGIGNGFSPKQWDQRRVC